MIERYFHRWEGQLAEVSQHERQVRPFEWGAPSVISVSWVPRSTIRPPSRTTIRSAIRTVLNRCEIRIAI